MDTKTDLIPLGYPPLKQLFDNTATMAAILAKIKTAALDETADPTTEDGRASIKSLAYKVSRSKTALDDVGKPLADAARVNYDSINAIRKTAKEFLDALRDEVRKPVDDWEEVEKQRIEALEDRLTTITAMGELDPHTETSIIEGAINVLEGDAINADWQEFAEKAAEEKTVVLEYLCRTLTAAQKREAEEAELEALRAEKLEREAQDAERAREAAIVERERVVAENARKQAENAAADALEREKDRAARAVQDAENRVAAAQREAAGAAQHERESIEAEREADEVNRRDREANDKHRHDRQETIFKALMRAPVKLSEGDATRLVGAVADQLIPFLRIVY